MIDFKTRSVEVGRLAVELKNENGDILKRYETSAGDSVVKLNDADADILALINGIISSSMSNFSFRNIEPLTDFENIADETGIKFFDPDKEDLIEGADKVDVIIGTPNYEFIFSYDGYKYNQAVYKATNEQALKLFIEYTDLKMSVFGDDMSSIVTVNLNDLKDYDKMDELNYESNVIEKLLDMKKEYESVTFSHILSTVYMLCSNFKNSEDISEEEIQMYEEINNELRLASNEFQEVMDSTIVGFPDDNNGITLLYRIEQGAFDVLVGAVSKQPELNIFCTVR